MGASGEDARAGGRRVPRHLTEAARLNSRIPRSPEGVGGGCGVLRVLGRINPRATHATYNERRAETTTGAWLAGPRGEPVPDRSHAGPSYDYARAAIDVRGASAGAVPRERLKRRLGFADACGMAAPRALPLARRRAEVYASASDDRVGRTVWAAFALLGVALVAYLGFMIFRRSWQFSPWLDGWLIVGFQSVACALCFAAGSGRRRHRAVAFVMGAACVSWTVGDLVLTLESLGGATPPTPSLADPFYLAFVPLALVAVVLFVRGEITRRDTANWLDGAIAALGMAALCSLFAFRGIEQLVGGFSLADATNLAYPLADLLLLGIVAGSTVFVASPRRATLVLIGLGIAVNAAGDTINFVQPASGASQFSAVLNQVAWPFSILMFALSMWVAEKGSERLAMYRVSGFALPGLLAASSLGILVLDNWYHVGSLAIALTAVTVVLAGVRLAFRPALRRARAQLRSSEERYRVLFEQNPLPMVTYDKRTLQIVAASNAMVATYGYALEQLGAMTIEDLEVPADLDVTRTDPASAADAGAATASARARSVVRHQRSDRTILEVEISADDVTVDGRECRIALYNDVTERNRMAAEAAIAHDRAVEASNMKSAFLANVSHEVRTPMNGVIGMTEMLLQTRLDEEQRTYAQQVEQSSAHMLAIINDILDISKIETGHLALDIFDFELDETIKEACSAAAALARAKGLRLEMRIATDVPRSARGDGRRLQQVLANLLANAVKFTTTGTITVDVSATPTPHNTTRIRAAVTDTGIGIQPASLQRMFEPFTQADVSTTRLYGGTGLGLAIAREIIELMGGTINADSTPGDGSTFWFEVDLAAPLASRTSPQPTAAANGLSASTWSTPPLVLVAEDSQINQIVASRVLERCGCRVDVVGDGAEALQALAAKRYDAVLMDCQMPGMDGYAATQEIRRREHGTWHTPVIAMTAHAMTGDRERCIDAGMDDYITKPVRHVDLVNVLTRWIPEHGHDSLQPPSGPSGAAHASETAGSRSSSTVLAGT
jgi:PAS domain S-box-containing protein